MRASKPNAIGRRPPTFSTSTPTVRPSPPALPLKGVERTKPRLPAPPCSTGVLRWGRANGPSANHAPQQCPRSASHWRAARENPGSTGPLCEDILPGHFANAGSPTPRRRREPVGAHRSGGSAGCRGSDYDEGLASGSGAVRGGEGPDRHRELTFGGGRTRPVAVIQPSTGTVVISAKVTDCREQTQWNCVGSILLPLGLSRSSSPRQSSTPFHSFNSMHG